jgi:hypothetical protein
MYLISFEGFIGSYQFEKKIDHSMSAYIFLSHVLFTLDIYQYTFNIYIKGPELYNFCAKLINSLLV